MRDRGEGRGASRSGGAPGRKSKKAKGRKGREKPELDFGEYELEEVEQPFSVMDFESEEEYLEEESRSLVEAESTRHAEEEILDLGTTGRRRAREPKSERSPRAGSAGGGGINFLIPIIMIAALATLVLSILFTHTKDAHWNFIYVLVLFILAAQLDIDVKGGGEINMGLAILVMALMVVAAKPPMPTVGVVWIFLFGTIIEAVVRLLGGKVNKDELFAMLVDYAGVGLMALLFYFVLKVLPKKPLFHGNYWPGLFIALGVAVAAYFLIELVHTTFVLSQEGHFPPAVYFSSALRRFWVPYLALTVIGVLMGVIYIGIGMWSVLFVIPLLLVLRYAYNRIARTDEYLLETIRTLSSIPEETGMVPEGHAERVADMSVAVARELGLAPEDVAQIQYAAYLHDIGAVTRGWGEQQQLSEVEGVIAGGVDVVGKVDYLEVAAEILRGREGLRDRIGDAGKRRAVSSGAGILRAVDDFETLVQGREGREPLTEAEALTEMNLERGVRYDSKVLRAIARSVGRVPKEGLTDFAEGSAESSPFWGDQES